VFQLAAIITLVSITASISSNFSSVGADEGPEVMHIIFIVTVGALPRVLEVALGGNEFIKRQLEEKHVEQSINRYWRTRWESSALESTSYTRVRELGSTSSYQSDVTEDVGHII